MMKFFNSFLFLFLTTMILSGCNVNDNDNVSAPPENASVEQDNHPQNAENNTQSDNLFAFTSFDLDVDFPGDKSFEVDYENDADGMEVEIEDNIVHNETLRGDEAFERLRPIFENFTFDKTTSEDKVISEVLKAFNLPTNYTDFDLDIRFNDGTEREYNR